MYIFVKIQLEVCKVLHAPPPRSSSLILAYLSLICRAPILLKSCDCDVRTQRSLSSSLILAHPRSSIVGGGGGSVVSMCVFLKKLALWRFHCCFEGFSLFCLVFAWFVSIHCKFVVKWFAIFIFDWYLLHVDCFALFFVQILWNILFSFRNQKNNVDYRQK